MRRVAVGLAGLMVAASVVALPAAASPAPSAAPAAAAEPVKASTSRIALTPAGDGGRAAARTSVETPERATSGYQTVGVTWAPGAAAELRAEVRTRTNGSWSGWQELELSDAVEEGAADVRGGTEPLWVGPSDGVQARVAATSGTLPPDLRVELIDPGTAAQDATADQRVERARAGQPTILTRRAWGADDSRIREPATIMSTIKAGIVHHTAGNNGYTRAQVPGIIRGDYEYHLSRGWNDIGYNILVDRFGRIWEGRAGGITRPVMGAHAGGFNTDTFGVSVLGNLDTARPTAATTEALAKVLAWKLDLHHRDPRGNVQLTARGADGTTSRYPDGTTVTKPVIMGHRDVGQTACPGRYLYPQLPAIRNRAAAITQAALIEPRASAAQVTYKQGGAYVSAVSNVAQRWTLTVRNACGNAVVAAASGSVGAHRRFTVPWSGHQRSGGWARPGRYTLTLTSTAGSSTARPVTTSVLVVPPAQPAAGAGGMTSGAGRFVPIQPQNLVDTRRGDEPLGPGGRVRLPILGRNGVPAGGVSSVVLQTTTVCPTARTALSAFPTGRGSWPTEAVNMGAPRIASAASVLPVGADGAVYVRNAVGVSDVVVDVIGYHTTTPGRGYGVVGGPRQRLYDSRGNGGAIANGRTRTFTVPAVAGLSPAQQTGRIVNVTVLAPRTAGMLEVFGGTSATGVAPRLHYPGGATHDERLFVRVVGGKITLKATGPAVNVVIDAVGAFGGAQGGGEAYSPITPVRLLDSRTTGNGFVTTGAPRTVRVAGVGGVPADARRVLVNVIGLTPQAPTRVTVSPAGRTDEAADLRINPGDIRGNLAVAEVSASGEIQIGPKDAPVKIVADLVGWYR